MAFASCTFIFFLLLLPLLAIAQTDGRVAVGASLTAAHNASPWLSTSGDFAFGFHPTDNEDLFLLSIWFDKIPGKTVVWYAHEDGNPVLVPEGSKIVLNAENGLLLSNARGERVWKSAVARADVAYGVMNDTGNFAIKSRNSDMLWESFAHPTDTLLPAQIMKINGQLFSRQKENNFSRGRFLLSLRENGDLVLNIVNLPTNLVYDGDGPYYNSHTSDPANESNSGNQLIFNESGDVYVLRRNGQRSLLGTGSTLPTPREDFYQRATLDFDGVFAQYYYPKINTGNDSWSTVWYQPENICLRFGGLGSGACGFNSICSLNENGRPTCNCPPGFSFLDPNDNYGSCERDGELDCHEDGQISKEDLYDIEVLPDTNWPTSDYERYGTNYDEQDCKTSCLNDCFCVVAIYGGGSCWMKKLPLSNGRKNSSDKSKAFIKVPRGDRPPSFPNLREADDDKNKRNLIITGSVLLGTSVFVNLALIGALCLSFFFIYKKKLSKIDQGGLETNLRLFTYKELAEATNGFEEKLGRGAFGVVYKGTTRMSASGSRISIAVKKLDRVVTDGDKEFKTEINVIGRTHHKNLVQLLGICEEGEQRLLVYEFLSNGTLAEYLFGNRKPSWCQRTQIALGVARGLVYLHEECSTQIIHCDIKPQNILLDDNYNARISDFGLSKLLMMDQTQTKTAIRGTKGYVAPEWFRNLPVTVKVDVYSFGVLLLEIICCRRSVVDEEMGDEGNIILTYWAYDCYSEGKIDALVSKDMEVMNDTKSLERFLMVAFWCIQEDPCLRPSMRKVIQMLEGVVHVTVPPNPSPFSTIG
ncbi:PREDICTED: G-type lectin S-receptor-like serine/threonine-protein kinase RLK1 [Theobroma cacao]|uniref:Receptor-like serine/threonine-protein kinase n=1 Tax=Theobroma cacao TaxID=3641 RepID=A0AB32WSR2_THECC|nr:PREDICTED: G-type lectin S-receptor-like serine/threonine-protein kinase RLK1 [Theobroma cacao]